MTAPDFGGKRALLLQGPNGPFFARFAEELRAHGLEVTKVNFHAGDAYFYRGPGAVAYRGRPADWSEFLRELLRQRQIDIVYVFGDGRPHHRAAAELCAELGIRFYVFEEGYLRPDWITLEQYGVNGYSHMPRDPDFFRRFAKEHAAPRQVEHLGPTFGIGAFYATWLALCATFCWFRYPHYRHHRSINAAGETVRWVLGAARKYWFRLRERGVLSRLSGPLRKRYFFVALQVHCDYQMVHSRFRSVEAFIEEVMASFAADAPQDLHLVIKHHPMDRPYREYGQFIRALAARHGLSERVCYVHDLHLPTLLRGARGSVMINSTVGLQSIGYGTPVKVLGDAVYDMPGATHQGDLRSFWTVPEPIDEALFRAFRTYLLVVNQANGAFARRLSSTTRGAGIRWFPGVRAERDDTDRAAAILRKEANSS